ncbi:MAG: hypothetical protein KGN00_13030 [Chloroflexota bacterium]|nr:hypothetical protein [Chloroflexota bacterium]
MSTKPIPTPVPPELVTPDRYPVLNAMRRHGDELSVATAVGVFCAVLASSDRRDAGAVLRAALLGALVGLGVKNLSELNDIIADTLVPQ